MFAPCNYTIEHTPQTDETSMAAGKQVVQLANRGHAVNMLTYQISGSGMALLPLSILAKYTAKEVGEKAAV